MGLGTELRFFQDPDRLVGLLQIADQRNLRRNGAMELNQHLLANRQLRIERLLMPSCIVKPNERRRQIDEYKPFFAANLNRRRGTKRYGFSPHRRDIRTTTDLRQDRVGIGLRIAEPETQDLIVGVGRAGPTQMPNRLDPIGLLINDVRAPIDQFEKLAIGLFLE